MKLFISLLSLVTFFSLSGALAGDNTPDWIHDQNRRVIGGDILEPGMGSSATPRQAILRAEGLALTLIANECGGFVHREVIISDRYLRKDADIFTAFARASISFDNCEEGKKASYAKMQSLKSVGLTAELKEFLESERTEDRQTASIEAPETSQVEGQLHLESPLAEKAFWLGVGVGGSSSSTGSLNDSGPFVTLGMEYNFTEQFALGIDYFGVVSSSDSSSSTKGFDLRTPVSVFYFNNEKERVFLEPSLFYQSQSLSTYNGETGLETSTDVNQLGWEGSIGMDILAGYVKETVPTVVSVKIGAGSPLVSSDSSAKSVFVRGGIGVSWGF